MNASPQSPIPLGRRVLCLVVLWIVACACVSISSDGDHLFTFFFSPILIFGAVTLPFSHPETPTLGMVCLGAIWFVLLAAALLSRWRPVFFVALLLHLVFFAICVVRIPHIPLVTRF